MAAEVKLELIIEALEMADDSVSSYLDVETGEVRSITEKEFDLAEDPQTVIEELPDWQREAVKLARSIQGLKGKDAVDQFVALHKSWEYSTFDVACEISANRKTVFLNWLFWSRHDFSKFGINQEQRETLLGHLKQCWEFNHIEVPLPQTING